MMKVTPAPEFMLAWCRANLIGTEQKGAVSVENFFKGCKTEQEKHDRVAAAFPDAYKAKPSG
jgi:hypothetical protein